MKDCAFAKLSCFLINNKGILYWYSNYFGVINRKGTYIPLYKQVKESIEAQKLSIKWCPYYFQNFWFNGQFFQTELGRKGSTLETL